MRPFINTYSPYYKGVISIEVRIIIIEGEISSYLLFDNFFILIVRIEYAKLIKTKQNAVKKSNNFHKM